VELVCIFCEIVKGNIPSKTIYEDEYVKAFYDSNPAAPVHFLVIPKEHIESAAEINADNSQIISKIFEVIAKLAKEMGFESGFRVVSNCGEDAGQTVKHLHFHVLAKRSMEWPPG
jgi:histidine triad (HIT) family protein